VPFAAHYDFENSLDQPREATFTVYLPAEQAIYDDVTLSVNGATLPITNSKSEAYVVALVEPQGTAKFHAQYTSQGLESWVYDFGGSVTQVRDFRLRATTDFAGFNFPDNTLSPTGKRARRGG
jgi:hypothetical protein